MRIALIGYGKMGKAIEQIAINRGHEIILKIDEDSIGEFNQANMQQADVAIEFTNPHSAFENIRTALGFKVPVVSGSTGWLDKKAAVEAYCNEMGTAFLYSSNFSLGVNIFFEINKKLATLMASQEGYNVAMEEIHHTEKKDAPSGTAITLAEQILARIPEKNNWVNNITNNPNELSIISKRIDPAPGTHSIKYTSPIDDIEIIHTAHSRVGFATGAVVAAEFLHDKKGVFGMADVLGLQ